jgi:hypothetical protein
MKKSMRSNQLPTDGQTIHDTGVVITVGLWQIEAAGDKLIGKFD